MIILEGLECKEQGKYCGLDKIYEFEILYGFTTDTYDILKVLYKIIIFYHQMHIILIII